MTVLAATAAFAAPAVIRASVAARQGAKMAVAAPIRGAQAASRARRAAGTSRRATVVVR